MTSARTRKTLYLGFAALGLASVLQASGAANVVPATRADLQALSISPNELKPFNCAGITLTNRVAGSGTFSGTDGNDLIVGSPGIDNIDGQRGNDCILGGGGNDSLRGSQDTDVCIGGPGTDSLHPSCETSVQ